MYCRPDLFAIPDFSAGAMENWGLITYRETALLYDEETDPATSKQRVAVVIAHELAHQVYFYKISNIIWIRVLNSTGSNIYYKLTWGLIIIMHH